jgi:hypothetical protein
MEDLGIYGIWNGDGTFTKICCVCEKQFISKHFRKLRCPDCMSAKKKTMDYDCEICGQGLTRKFYDINDNRMHRLCANHYYMAKVERKPLQELLTKKGVQSNG